jgi:formylglycine-generating enzyme required for sulfatase activity
MRQPPSLCLGCLALVLAALALSVAAPVPRVTTPTLAEAVPRVEPARHKGYTETVAGARVGTKAARFDMVAIPGGAYRMGSPADEAGRGADEGPQHPVQVRPFWMGKMEVTWDEYDLYRLEQGNVAEADNDKARAKDADAITRPTQPYPDEYRGMGRERHPAVGISHYAAMEYCRWLSARTGRAYRLPTEAEWEWACRASSRTPYFFGTEPGQLGAYAWYGANSEDQTHPVGQKKPNPWGLHDIYGNVAEWCLDHYHKDSYAPFGVERLTLGPVKLPTAARYSHVVRGGSWEDPAGKCRSAARRGSDKTWNQMDPDQPQSIWWLWDADFVGFRVVRAVEEQENLKGIKSQVTKRSK